MGRKLSSILDRVVARCLLQYFQDYGEEQFCLEILAENKNDAFGVLGEAIKIFGKTESKKILSQKKFNFLIDFEKKTTANNKRCEKITSLKEKMAEHILRTFQKNKKENFFLTKSFKKQNSILAILKESVEIIGQEKAVKILGSVKFGLVVAGFEDDTIPNESECHNIMRKGGIL